MDEMMVNIPINEFKCPICLTLAQVIISSTVCSHIWCEVCDKQIKKCPICRQEKKTIRSNLFISRLMDNYIKSNCENKGCEFEGNLFKIKEHQIECKFRKIKCNDCGNGVIKNNIENHHKYQCINREVDCPSCFEKICLVDYECHINERCSSLKSKCKYCSIEITYNKLNEHQLECVEFPVKCLNCGERVKKKDYFDHMKRECLYRNITCIECKTEIKYCDSVSHSKYFCSETILECHLCKCKLKRSEMFFHSCEDSKSINSIDSDSKISQKCPECGIILHSGIESLKNHMNECYGKYDKNSIIECICKTKIKISDLNQHYKICKYYPVLCKYCNLLFQEHSLNKHVNYTCQYREVSCESCNKNVLIKDLPKHINNSVNNSCKGKICPVYGCFRIFKNSDNLMMHMKSSVQYHKKISNGSSNLMPKYKHIYMDKLAWFKSIVDIDMI